MVRKDRIRVYRRLSMCSTFRSSFKSISISVVFDCRQTVARTLFSLVRFADGQRGSRITSSFAKFQGTFQSKRSFTEKVTSDRRSGSNYETRSETIFQILGWNPMANIFEKRELLITFKAIRGTAPECISNMFSYCDNVIHQMRSKWRKLTYDKPNKSFMKKPF